MRPWLPLRAAEDSGPYGRDSSHSVGADVPIRPERFVRQRRADDIRPYTKCRLHFVGAAISYLKFVTCF